MAFPQREGTATFTKNGGTVHSTSLPSSIASGELLLLIATANQTLSSGPSGWTSLASSANTHWFYKIADGTEGATVDITYGSSAISWAVSERWSGASGDVEIAVASGGDDPPNLTPSWGAADTTWVTSGGIGPTSPNTDTLVAPTNYIGKVVAVLGFGAAETAYRELNASSENPGDWSGNGNFAPVATIAIEPGGGVSAAEGSGDLSTPATTLSGAAVSKSSASGALDAQPITAAGAAESLSDASGALDTPAVTADGAAVSESTATGDAAIPGTTAEGAAESLSEGTGDLSPAPVTGSGAGTSGSAAEGALPLAATEADGAAASSSEASGAADLAAITASGVGAVASDDIQGSGTLNIAAFLASGAALSSSEGEGAATIPATTADGAALSSSIATGALDLAILTAAGAASSQSTATGAISGPLAGVEGDAVSASAGTGALTTGAPDAAGTAALGVTASGAISAAILTANGLGVSKSIATGAAVSPAATATGVGNRPGGTVIAVSSLNQGPIERDFKGPIQPVIRDTFAYDVTYHRLTRTADNEGGWAIAETDTTLKAFILEDVTGWHQTDRNSRHTAEVIIDQTSIAAAPTLADRLTIRSRKYRIIRVEEDPAHATWILTVREA